MHASPGFSFAPPLVPLAEPRASQDAPSEGDDDAADDPLRTYLREIHEVHLLTAADERELACRIEERVGLLRIQAEVHRLLEREPSALDISVDLCLRLHAATDIVDLV